MSLRRIFNSEIESRLKELASKSGRPADDRVEEAPAGYLEAPRAISGETSSIPLGKGEKVSAKLWWPGTD
jgi:hypothetical protein